MPSLLTFTAVCVDVVRARFNCDIVVNMEGSLVFCLAFVSCNFISLTNGENSLARGTVFIGEACMQARVIVSNARLSRSVPSAVWPPHSLTFPS